MNNLFLKTLREKRAFIIGWSLGLFFLGFAMTTFFTSFSGDSIKDLLEGLPPALAGLVGNAQDWSQLSTYIGGQVFDIRLPILIGVLAIVLAIGLSVTEEDKGLLRTTVALPISRTRIVLAKWFAVAVICLVAAGATVAGVETGALAINETVDQSVLLQLGLMTWLMTTALATLIFAAGMATGLRVIAMPVGVIVVAGGFFITTFAAAVDWLKNYEWLSIFHYFPATEIAKQGIAVSDVLVYLAVIVVSLATAIIVFRRRDIYAE